MLPNTLRHHQIKVIGIPMFYSAIVSTEKEITVYYDGNEKAP